LSKSLLFEMLVHKCNFLLKLLLKINAYFSLFYCNKTGPGYEFLVVFGQMRVWDWKSAGWDFLQRGVGAGAGCVGKFLKLLWVRDGFKFCWCRAGADTKFQPMQDSSAYISGQKTKSIYLN